MRAVGYIRVSTDDQAQTGVSLEAQEHKVRAYCVAKDWELVRVVRDEGYSAKDLNRPGMREVVRGARAREFDVVVVMKLDRLTRSVKDLGYLVEDVFERNGVAFSSLQDNFDTSTANGRLVMNILATIAQWERDVISERTREAMQFMRNGLMRVGAVPYGFRQVGGRLEPEPKELGLVRQLVDMKRGGQSYGRIAAALNDSRVPSKHGGRWHSKTVMGVLRYFQSLPGDHWVITTYFPKGVDT